MRAQLELLARRVPVGLPLVVTLIGAVLARAAGIVRVPISVE